MKTGGIDTKKLTLAYIWYEHVWHAYDTKFSRAYDIEICWYVYDTHLPHNPNPTHCVVIFFVSIPRVFIFIWHTIYTHFQEIGLEQQAGWLQVNIN